MSHQRSEKIFQWNKILIFLSILLLIFFYFVLLIFLNKTFLKPKETFAKVAGDQYWTQATANAGWSNRGGHTSLVFDNKMRVLGGWDGSRKNDVWYSRSDIWDPEGGIPLVGKFHTVTECININGTLVKLDGTTTNKQWCNSNPSQCFCKFSSSSCPVGWSQYLNWSTTKAESFNAPSTGNYLGFCMGSYSVCVFTPGDCVSSSCSTSYHSWSNTPVETCEYGGKCHDQIGEYKCCQKFIGEATRTKIGCY